VRREEAGVAVLGQVLRQPRLFEPVDEVLLFEPGPQRRVLLRRHRVAERVGMLVAPVFLVAAGDHGRDEEADEDDGGDPGDGAAAALLAAVGVDGLAGGRVHRPPG
jgi:hypothetical protein